MQKIILDTNVIVAALISNSVPTMILYDLVLTQEVNICLSNEIYLEYLAVLNRDKFSKFSNFKSKANIVVSQLLDTATFYETNIKIDILTDTSDNKFLELAAVSNADFLITGNTLDFNLTEFEYTKIVTPRTYWDNFKPIIN
ncbi:MAG: putative toxin-antitoxin system toxin component, PIN family [Chitinophagales bacterium]|nr:putative toxin-antitoxin system toxin component, PIN family [Chitinophagales bacterium]